MASRSEQLLRNALLKDEARSQSLSRSNSFSSTRRPEHASHQRRNSALDDQLLREKLTKALNRSSLSMPRDSSSNLASLASGQTGGNTVFGWFWNESSSRPSTPSRLEALADSSPMPALYQPSETTDDDDVSELHSQSRPSTPPLHFTTPRHSVSVPKPSLQGHGPAPLARRAHPDRDATITGPSAQSHLTETSIERLTQTANALSLHRASPSPSFSSNTATPRGRKYVSPIRIATPHMPTLNSNGSFDSDSSMPSPSPSPLPTPPSPSPCTAEDGPCTSPHKFNLRHASQQCKEMPGYVSFAAIDGLGEPPASAHPSEAAPSIFGDNDEEDPRRVKRSSWKGWTTGWFWQSPPPTSTSETDAPSS